jgi:hypothetical protein
MAKSDDPIERFHAACGELIRAWARLEAALVLHLKMLLATDPHRARLVWISLPTLTMRLSLLRSLAETYLDQKTCAKLGAVLDRVAQLEHKRTLVAQCVGGIDSRTGKVTFVSDGPNAAFDAAFLAPVNCESDKVETWTGEVSALERDVIEWIRMLVDAVQAAPQTYRVSGDPKS